MRVLMTSWAWNSHFYPLVPTAWALSAAGHDVVVSSHPCLAPAISAAGLTALPAGPDVDAAADLRAMGSFMDRGRPILRLSPDQVTPEIRARIKGQVNAMKIFVRSAADIAPDTLEFARAWRPDLVIFEPLSFVGPLVAAKLGIPAVRQLYTVDSTTSVRQMQPRLLADLRARFGCDRINTMGDLTLDPCPVRLQITDDLPRQRMRYLPYTGPAVHPRLPPPRRPRICVSWGTSMQGLGFGITVPLVVRALAGLDVDVVVAVVAQQRHLFSPRPDNVSWIGPVPLDLVLPSCDLLVHQGGGGTMMAGVVAGVPQVVLPHIADQMYNAEQLAATGAGEHAWAAEIDESRVRAMVERTLRDDRRRRQARRLADESAALPAPADVVAVLTELAATGRWLPELAPSSST
jgi:UDP:flavonoid glycosyltransferase YjiC (YdhE family)